MTFSTILLSISLFLPTIFGRNVVHMHQDKGPLYPASEGLTLGWGEKGTGGKFAFASYYSDHMVLQQAPRRAVVWGYYPDVGDRIIVKVSGREKVYAADVTPSPDGAGGVWSVELEPIPGSSTPVSISAMADDGASVSISDVLFGDVWVCSGQSNMQFSTFQIFNATEELDQASKYRDVRLFTVAEKYSTTPLYDLAEISEQWTLPNKTTVGNAPFTYFSAVCWLYGRRLNAELGYPIGLIDTTWGGTPVEAWSSPAALAKCGIKTEKEDKTSLSVRERKILDRLNGPDDNSQLWNAMVHPLLNMTIYGAIWYQGEADSSGARMNTYNCTFPAMIDDWRLKWNAQTDPTFPFGFVQLAPNRADNSVSVGFPDIRWHQTADYGYVPNERMKNVFMAVALDLPDFTSPYGSIHPRDKQDVAQRLFLSGLDVAYGRPQKFQGPRPTNVTATQDLITLFYGNEWKIQVRSSEGFELCCSIDGTDLCTAKDSWWLPTPVKASSADSVSVDGGVCGEGQYVAGVRYAWRESPCVVKQCAVYAEENQLPAPPFVAVKPQNQNSAFSYTIDWSKPQIIPF